jgi:hypothetical protein
MGRDDDGDFVEQERECPHMTVDESDRWEPASLGEIAPRAYHNLGTRKELANQRLFIP